jgi:hypothetical protein
MEKKLTSIGKFSAQISQESLSTGLTEPDQSKSNDPSGQFDQLLAKVLRDSNGIDVAQVFVRSMWVVSDEVNSYGGVLSSESHPQIAELMLGAPILVGHQTDSLPIARVFHAMVAERDGRSWVRAFFYWLREADGAETLRANIDGGIYQECSISFLYTQPICLLCHQDIRECGHEPNREYRVHGRRQVCNFRYDGISKVLECSLVYRGAIPNTLVTAATLSESSTASIQESIITNLKELPAQEWFLVTPRYEGIRVDAEIDSTMGEIRLRARQESMDEMILPIRRSERLCHQASGMLVGYRNRSRVGRQELLRAVRGEESDVTRTVLYLLPQKEKIEIPLSSHPQFEIRRMPHASVHQSQLESRIATLASRQGVDIWPWGSENTWNEVFGFASDELSNKKEDQIKSVGNVSDRHVLQLSAIQSGRLRAGELLITDFHDESAPVKAALRNSEGDPIQPTSLIWQKIRRRGMVNWGVRMTTSSRHVEKMERQDANCG